MKPKRLLTDEHVPGPVVTVLRSLGHDVVRAKDTFPEGTEDVHLLKFSWNHDRSILTADKQFTVVGGSVVTEHAGVIYADQLVLQTRPAETGETVDRILSVVPPDERYGREFYLSHWMN